MQKSDVIRAWGRILTGYQPTLSIEITKECPLSCPGCYAFQPGHLGDIPFTSLADRRGEELVEAILDVIDRKKPLVVYLVGGEPLVRFRELSQLLPRISERKIQAEVVTSAVRPLPEEWAEIDRLNLVVSIDGLPAEHDVRRKPATYERILKHIEGHHIAVHCTVTGQMMNRQGYLEEFVRFWDARPEVRAIRFSLFTPQVGETGPEILSAEERVRAVEDMRRLMKRFSTLQLTEGMLDSYLNPPESPDECIFARVTSCVSADLETSVTPCQFGGHPDCHECGCVASMALDAVGNHRLPGGLQLRKILRVSESVGRGLQGLRDRFTGSPEKGRSRPVLNQNKIAKGSLDS